MVDTRIYRFELTPAGNSGPPQRPDLPYAGLLVALGLCPRRALSSAEATTGSVPAPPRRNELLPKGVIIPVLIARHCPVLVAPRQTKWISLETTDRELAGRKLKEVIGQYKKPVSDDSERKLAALHEKIGELTVSLDWLKKECRQLGLSLHDER